ncbi:MAG: hypothetical protein HQK77_17575 [Desulfobacterales bacterium]|nr:hypothetical protein [Desulfobacterales bacterium]
MNYYKKLFYVGAIWNCSIAFFSLFFYKPLFYFFHMAIPDPPVWLFLFLGAVVVFGLGYFWVGIDLTRNDGIVKMGIIGKIGFFSMTVYSVFTSVFHPIMLLPATIDIVFAILFGFFLYSQYTQSERNLYN